MPLGSRFLECPLGLRRAPVSAGQQYTAKLESMFRDLLVAGQLMDEFTRYKTQLPDGYVRFNSLCIRCCAHAHVHIYIYTYIYIWMYLNMYVLECIYINMPPCIRVCIWMPIHYRCTSLLALSELHIYAYMHILMRVWLFIRIGLCISTHVFFLSARACTCTCTVYFWCTSRYLICSL